MSDNTRYDPDEVERNIDVLYEADAKAQNECDVPDITFALDIATAANAAVRELQAENTRLRDTIEELILERDRERDQKDEYDSALAERDARIAELEADCTEWKNIRDGWEETAALLRTERDEAREIAEKYGQHKPGCDVYAKSDGDDKRPLPCTCGYDKAKKTMEAWG